MAEQAHNFTRCDIKDAPYPAQPMPLLHLSDVLVHSVCFCGAIHVSIVGEGRNHHAPGVPNQLPRVHSWLLLCRTAGLTYDI